MEKLFFNNFGKAPEYTVKSFGRFEILGNHTDHNGGLCLAAACNLGITGLCSKRNDLKVNICSKGYNPLNICLCELEPVESEKATSEGLVRGIARYFKDNGKNIGGFDLYIESTIFKGAGVSSSAAYEILIGQIFNSLFNNGEIDEIFLAKAGQFAENNFFGKNSGLLDQTSIAFSNISFLNFENQAAPKVENIKFPFDDVDIILCNTGGDHSSMSHLYSNIPNKMHSAARKIGHKLLIEGDMQEIEACNELDKDEKDFATHFYNENARVKEMINALNNKDKTMFYQMVNGSRLSSTNLLRNMQVENEYNGSPKEACDIVMSVVGNDGACKINGGGFAGSIVCFVDHEKANQLKETLIAKYGKDNVVTISVATEKPCCKRI